MICSSLFLYPSLSLLPFPLRRPSSFPFLSSFLLSLRGWQEMIGWLYGLAPTTQREGRRETLISDLW